MIDSRDRSASGIYVTQIDFCLSARIGDCLVDVGDRVFESYSQRVGGAAKSFAEHPATRIGDYCVGFSSASIDAKVILPLRSGGFVD